MKREKITENMTEHIHLSIADRGKSRFVQILLRNTAIVLHHHKILY